LGVRRGTGSERPRPKAQRPGGAAEGDRQPRFLRLAAWAFTLPGVLFQFFFGWFPVLIAFLVAFQHYYLARPPEFAGLQNFRDVVADPLTPVVFGNTFYYALLALGLTFLVPIVVSILLIEMPPAVIRVMMVLWFLPVASMAGIVIWKYFYSQKLGLLNGLLTHLGLPTQRWLDDPALAMISLVLPGLILFGPGLVYIASLQGIPEELYEAAELEGAGFVTKIRRITLPRLRPVIAMMLIFSIIGSLQVFEGPFIMTGGGPGYATTTAVIRIYDLAFKAYNLGKSTALAIALFLVVMTLIVLQRRYFKENLDE
jgi:multiple sugar transport system permease protein